VSTEDYRIVDDSEGPATRTEPAPEPPSRTTTRSTRRPARGGATKGPRTASKARSRKAPSPPETRPADAVRGLLQIPATAVVIVGQRVGSVPLVADGATILVHGPAFAEAVEEIANHDPRVMAMLEKLVAFGPYGMFVTVCVMMGAQFRRNHDETNAAILEGFGAVPPEKIIAQASLDVPASAPSPNGQRDSADVAPPAI
jgi:hypothetical protein